MPCHLLMSRARIGRVVAAVALCLVAPNLATLADAKRPRPVACQGGRFVVAGPRLIGDSQAPGIDAVVIVASYVSIDSGCYPARARMKATRAGTRVRATWKSCDGLQGRVRLVAKIAPGTCDHMSGTLRSKGRRTRFHAAWPVPPTLVTGDFTPVPLDRSVVGPSGGTLAVSDPASPLHGLLIEVPPGAAREDVTFTVSAADVLQASGLPPGAFVAGLAIRIAAAGSERFEQYRMLDSVARITLPYGASPAEEWVRFYERLPDGSLTSAGFLGQDLTAHTITFLQRVFGETAPTPDAGRSGARDLPIDPSILTAATFYAIGWALEAPNPTNILRSSFLPEKNGWYIPNAGSYYLLNGGGSCHGMAGTAVHYFRRGYTPPLFEAYRDNWLDRGRAPTQTWVDDAIAIEYTSRAQAGLNSAWTNMRDMTLNPVSAAGVLRTMLGGIVVTAAPVLVRVTESYVDQLSRLVTSAERAAHMVSVYAAAIPKDFQGEVFLAVYDPSEPGKGRAMYWRSDSGFDPFPSAGGTYQYNHFTVVGFHAAMSDAELDALKRAADGGFADGSVFPKVTITSIEGANDGIAAKEGTSVTGEKKFTTADTSVRIRGTILGGLAQVPCCTVRTASVVVDQDVYDTPVNNSYFSGDGTFDVTVPIRQGEHEVVIIGGTYGGAFQPSVDYWSAFHRTIVESTASPATLSIELTWEPGEADVDLYVKEPDGPAGSGKTGDTVYWAHRRGTSDANPFLDIDDTRKQGPEHYYAKLGMKTLYTDASAATGLYGQYVVKAHYYADHDGDTTQVKPIRWTLRWRYLAYCPDPCLLPDKVGTWRESSATGQLSAANAGNAHDITHTGPDWSPAVPIDYQPEPPPPDPPTRANLP